MRLGIIGGSGAISLFEQRRNVSITTPFGAPSDRPREIELDGRRFWFIARHGDPHRIPPHRVNYRANIHALRTLGVDSVLALNAVGGLDRALRPGDLVVPDQLVDYTWGRAHTFSDGGSARLLHVDFTRPYDGSLRTALLAAGQAAGIGLRDGGCQAVTQGPRLETAAEVARLARDGCDLVGMTGMPEAGLAREAGLDYASLCIVANPAAGLAAEAITEDEIGRVLAAAMVDVRRVLDVLVATLDPVGE